MIVFKNKQGFTLIELLIVIALLGALAVGLLAAVDPFEQLKKGRDTSTRNTAAEFYNAAIRYYAQKAKFPWEEPDENGKVELDPGNVTDLASLPKSISAMAAAGELKEDFIELAGTANLARIFLTFPEAEKLIVCFRPESKAFRNDQNTKYDQTGALNTGNPAKCPNPNTDVCYYCFK